MPGTMYCCHVHMAVSGDPQRPLMTHNVAKVIRLTGLIPVAVWCVGVVCIVWSVCLV